MICESFDAKDLSSIVASVKDIDPQFFRKRVRPMWSLARHERVHSFLGGLLQVAAGSACDDTHTPADVRAARNNSRPDTSRNTQTPGKFCPRDFNRRLKSKKKPMVEEKGPAFVQAERITQPRVVSKDRMSIQRQMRRIHREVVFHQLTQK